MKSIQRKTGTIADMHAGNAHPVSFKRGELRSMNQKLTDWLKRREVHKPLHKVPSSK